MGDIKERYQEGGLWLLKKGTYTKQVVDMLKETATLSLKEGFIVLAMPAKEETERCQAAVANVAHALRGCFDAEFPSIGIQRMWGSSSWTEMHGGGMSPKLPPSLRRAKGKHEETLAHVGSDRS